MLPQSRGARVGVLLVTLVLVVRVSAVIRYSHASAWLPVTNIGDCVVDASSTVEFTARINSVNSRTPRALGPFIDKSNVQGGIVVRAQEEYLAETRFEKTVKTEGVNVDDPSIVYRVEFNSDNRDTDITWHATIQGNSPRMRYVIDVINTDDQNTVPIIDSTVTCRSATGSYLNSSALDVRIAFSVILVAYAALIFSWLVRLRNSHVATYVSWLISLVFILKLVNVINHVVMYQCINGYGSPARCPLYWPFKLFDAGRHEFTAVLCFSICLAWPRVNLTKRAKYVIASIVIVDLVAIGAEVQCEVFGVCWSTLVPFANAYVGVCCFIAASQTSKTSSQTAQGISTAYKMLLVNLVALVYIRQQTSGLRLLLAYSWLPEFGLECLSLICYTQAAYLLSPRVIAGLSGQRPSSVV